MIQARLILISLLIGLLTCCSHFNSAPQPISLSAQEYIQMASNALSPQKEQYQIMAARRYLQNRRIRDALNLLNAIDLSHLPPKVAISGQLTLAQALILNQQYQLSLSTLNLITSQGNSLSPAQQIRWYQLAAQAYLRTNQPMQSINARDDLAHLIPNNDPQYKDNLQAIWDTLQQFTREELQQRNQSIVSKGLQGWFNLALMIDQPNLTQQQLIQQLNQWRQNYPNHVANGLLPKNLTASTFNQPRPNKIALLLPITGPLKNSAQAIRNGFTAAYYYARTKHYQPTIVVVNTADKNINNAYQRAIHQGAQFVVGPLTKTNVQTLQQNPQLPLPTLALNSLPNQSRSASNLFTFGLSPIDEAIQVAKKDWQDQHRRVIIIAPDNKWGNNIAQAFITSWKQYGNSVTARYNYNGRTSLAKGLRQLLQLSQSSQRARQLRALLHRKIRTILRRRKDFDSIFLIATNKMARQIQPLLRYYYAGDIPVYALSPVYTGTPNISHDRDLNNIQFCDIPWVITPNRLRPPYLQTIRSNIQKTWPQSFRRYPKLYALGVDSFDLISRLHLMAVLPAFGNKAATGTLYLTAQHHIFRQLPWAKVEKGKIIPMA